MLSAADVASVRSDAGFAPSSGTSAPQNQGGDLISNLQAAASAKDNANAITPITPQNQGGGFFSPSPSGESPYKTGNPITSPLIEYGNQSNTLLGTLTKAAVNTPTSIIRLANNLTNPQTYIGFSKALAGGIESIPGIKEFYDNMSSANGKQVLQSNRDAFSNFVDQLENQYGSFENIKRSIAEDPAGTALIVRGLMEGASGVAEKSGFPETASTLKSVGQNVFPIEKISNISNAFSSGSDLKNRIQAHFGEQNVTPQLEQSAKSLNNPVDKYDQYYQQAKKGATDIKSDTALSKVGSEIGNAFDSVITQRRAVGKLLGNELKNVSNEPIQINTEPFIDKIKEAAPSLTKSDTGLASQYIKELNILGTKPTVGELDAFLRRVPQEVTEYKGSKGITQTTPAEGFIKQNLSELRNSMNPEQNPKLTNYINLRKTYSDLSNFLDEGVQYLGEKTQTGDYAKDSSLAKSSVQSILNNGKKDWLLKLQGITGYPALDNSVLALQAMKDAGDFRGTSLLQKLSEGAPPVTPHGITGKIFDWALNKAGQKVVGTPYEQTRAFLKSLTTSETESATTPKANEGTPTSLK